jgi:hypothetical protein
MNLFLSNNTIMDISIAYFSEIYIICLIIGDKTVFKVDYDDRVMTVSTLIVSDIYTFVNYSLNGTLKGRGWHRKDGILWGPYMRHGESYRSICPFIDSKSDNAYLNLFGPIWEKMKIDYEEMGRELALLKK